MKITRLEIRNFKAIENITLEKLGNLVLIAGQNGVGKSCIFDAIRLLKSSYGNYNPNELQNWFNEFQLRIGNDYQFGKILRDKSKPVLIAGTFALSENEIEYLKNNGEKLIENLLWRVYTKNPNIDPIDEHSSSFATNQRMYADKISKEVKSHIKEFLVQIESNEFHASVELVSENNSKVKDNIILEVLFSTFAPEHLGIIDFHGAHRTYQKEQIQNLNLRFDNKNNLYKDSALYNYQNKYNNIKTEMASGYVKALIARENGVEKEAISTLNNSLNNLFSHFFPGKEFGGIVPTKEGSLEFPVKLKTGEIHDITELSSGEKEVLFGYLRLKNQAPKNSVILIDEPELHLNPKLAKKLPEFYYNTIGNQLNNQIWLVTHSDAILKESVGNKKFSVFYMSESLNDNKNQARELSETEIETALIDLIGDISSYQHGNKVVIFEGLDSEFDKKMTNTLFPEFENSINSISAGSKTNVTNVQNILKAASEDGIISKKFISIVDKDSEKVMNDLESLEFTWDVYHIENYLLNETFIFKILTDLDLLTTSVDSEEKILKQLKECARTILNFHIRHELYLFVSHEMQSSFRSKINENNSLSDEYYATVENTINEIESKKLHSLSKKELFKKEKLTKNKFENALKDTSWKSVFNGRNILKSFVGKHCDGIRYEQFRNLLISKMKHEKYQPEGMKNVIDEIIRI